MDKKKIISSTFTGNVFVSKKIVVVVIAIILSLAFVNVIFASKVTAYLQQSPSQDILAQPNTLPHAKLIYNNQYYDMSTFVYVHNGKLDKIQYPSFAGDFQDGPTLRKGSPINFQFDRQPVRIDAFVADYESDVPELFVLKKIDANTFELSGPAGLYNIEVHAIFADGQYTSHTLLANIVDNSPTSTITDITSMQPTLSDTATQGDTTKRGGDMDNNNNNDKITPELSCNRPIKVVVGENAFSSGADNVNVRRNSLGNDPNPRTWSTKGIDLLSFASTTTTTKNTMENKNPWISLDLGANNLICNIGITFGNGDNSVNYFTVQTSTDGTNFKDLGLVESTPVTASGQGVYSFPDLPDMTRYIRIANLGNVPVGSVKIAELAVLGS